MYQGFVEQLLVIMLGRRVTDELILRTASVFLISVKAQRIGCGSYVTFNDERYVSQFCRGGARMADVP
jgi:hypothetical protein